jgi:dTDP-4-dehydrorhamnose reductase
VRVLVTGAAGQLGGATVEAFARADEVVALTRPLLDITDLPAVLAAVARTRPDVLVNCAAYNDVDRAEDDPVAALQVNALGVRNLARAAAAQGATLVHFSTDFVFDGIADRPYTEEDQPNPQGVYASSKLLGEWFAHDAPRWYVLRVESLFGAPHTGRQGSVERIIERLMAGEDVPVFVDRTVSPSYVYDVAAATRRLLDAPAGLYHCVNSGFCTWQELAQEVQRLVGGRGRLRPIALEAAALRVRRPRFCALDNGKLAASGFVMPAWQDALQRHLARAC